MYVLGESYILLCYPINSITDRHLLSSVITDIRLLSSTVTDSTLGFNVTFNSQGHIWTGPQHFHLWDLNSHRGDSLLLDAKLANHKATEDPLFLLLTFVSFSSMIAWHFIDLSIHLFKLVQCSYIVCAMYRRRSQMTRTC